MRFLACGPRRLPLDRPLVMGIVNVTPDSFSDGGRFLETGRAVDHGLALAAEGADIVDVGGESTRPGAEPVSLDEELTRVVPVVEALARQGLVVSVDTMKPGVMRAAVAAGAVLVNDVKGFRAEGAVEALAEGTAAACIMHMQGTPATMQADPQYGDVVKEVGRFLAARAEALEAAGIGRERILVDPGFGFGKTTAHNLALLRNLRHLATLGWPLLAGLSRKRLIGEITGRPLDDRVAGSVAAALVAVQNGAALVRVHDVKPTVDALKVWAAVARPSP